METLETVGGKLNTVETRQATVGTRGPNLIETLHCLAANLIEPLDCLTTTGHYAY